MVTAYTTGAKDRATGEVVTHEGGTAYAVDDWARLRRFLILGSEGGTFYVGERALTRENAAVVARCLDADPVRAVAEIVAISEAGRAPKNDPAIFALALAASRPTPLARGEALCALDRVCRTGTHLFHFAAYVRAMRGWGRALRRAVGLWYQEKDLDDLAYQAIKYRQRDGWTHRDLLRLAHPRASDRTDAAQRHALYCWIVDGDVPPGAIVPRQVAAFEELKDLKPEAVDRVRALIVDHRLPREAVPTELLGTPAVWDALLADMPLGAMLRNLGTMSKVGLLVAGSDAARTVCERLADAERLTKARVHPLAVLVALKTYAQGHGERSTATWQPVPRVVDALDGAFYAAFGNVETTGQAIVLGVDSSGSMTGAPIAGMPLSCAEAAAAMALVTARVEPNAEVVCFDTTIRSIPISPRQRLDDVVRAMRFDGGGTYCSLVPKWATHVGMRADAVIMYTDSATHDRDTYPALLDHRNRACRDTRGIVVAMSAYDYSLFPASDPLNLQVVGFDTATPALVADFVADRV